MDFNGEFIEETLEGFRARVFMHEFDHLDGELISSFSNHMGEIEVEESDKHPELERIINDYKLKVNNLVNVLEDKYLCDNKFKKIVDKSDSKLEHFYYEIVT